MFFSTMSWYLANGSLNDYLRSQVLLQSKYYTTQAPQLLTANYSPEKGITDFSGFSMANTSGSSQPILFSVEQITAQLAPIATSQLSSPSIQNKNTTIVHIEKITLSQLAAWSEINIQGQTNIDIVLEKIKTQLASDYPVLYPEISARMYAEKHPERSEALALGAVVLQAKPQTSEINQAIIASNEAKQKKRILGKGLTRVIVSSLAIEHLTLTTINGTQQTTTRLEQVDLGGIGNENGIDSNQLGGEILRRLFSKLSSMNVEK